MLDFLKLRPYVHPVAMKRYCIDLCFNVEVYYQKRDIVMS